MTARSNASDSSAADSSAADSNAADNRQGPGALPVPNHHADHPGFSGVSGLLAAVGFLFGRERAAHLAIDLAVLQPGERLLDVGCGPGVAARWASRLGAQVIGVDPSPAMLRVARTHWRRPSIEWRIGAAESLPAPDAWAQVVWSLATVHHWSDVDAALGEARRVLAPDGRLVVLERRIEDTSAAGTASHGWTTAQRSRSPSTVDGTTSSTSRRANIPASRHCSASWPGAHRSSINRAIQSRCRRRATC